VAAVLVLAALVAPALAAANVPDLTWIAGVYDGGDGDEILALVWDGTPAVVVTPPVLSAPSSAVVEPVPVVARAVPRVPRAAACRAPPQA
jgi:hypothetical protein